MTLDAAAATRAIRRGRVVALLALLLLAALYVIAWQFTPPERFQGIAQRIFYIHPPAAYAMQLAFICTGIASILYLWLKDARLDAYARLLYDQAVIAEGSKVADPVAFARRVNDLITVGAK